MRMSFNDSLRPVPRVSFLFVMFLMFATTSDGVSLTVNSESFLEVVTGKIAELDSKVDLLLKAENEGKTQRVDSTMENQICSLNSRMIEVENEINGLKSAHAVPRVRMPSASSGKERDMISSLHSIVTALQNCFENEKSWIIELKQYVQGLSGKDHFPVPEEEIEINLTSNGRVLIPNHIKHVGNLFPEKKSCDFKNVGENDILSHLVKVNSNIFLGKPSNSSSLYSTGHSYQVFNAIDGDINSHYHSKKESNPWYFVDLQVPHFIWEIQLTLRDAARVGDIKIYLANDITFLEDGKPDVKSLPLFNNQEQRFISTTFTYRRPRGMCGRYVVICREITDEFLIINEIQGPGYAFQ